MHDLTEVGDNMAEVDEATDTRSAGDAASRSRQRLEMPTKK